MATPNKNTIAPLGSTERTNQLLGGDYFDTKTGKQIKAFVPQTNPSLTFNPSVVPTTVSSANLKPTAPMVLPKAPIPTEGIGMRGAIETSLNTAKAERDRQANLQIEETRNAKNQNLNDIVQLQEMLGQTGARTERAYQQAGVDKLQQEYDNFTNQLEQESHSLTRKLEELDKNPEGLFGGALNQEKERISRESLRKQADLAILQNSSLRKYDSARSIADRKIALELEPLKARLETMKFIYGENKELFNTQEKRAYETSIREEERQYKEQELNKTKSNDYILNAVQGGAPTNLVQKAQSLYNNGASAQEIAKTLGSYSLSASERLDMEIKRANIDKIKKDALAQGIKLTKEELEKEEAKLAQIPVLEDKLRLINSIKTAKGLDSRVGINKATRTGFAISDAFGAGQDFAASVQQLTNAETLATLLELKKGGGTLGAVNEKEFETLRNAATKINSWEVKDKNGQGKGEWAIDEKTFLKEVERLQKSTENLYKSLGGSLDSISDVDSYVNQVDQTLKSTNNIYSNSGYDLN